MEQDKILYKKFLEGDNEAFNEIIKKHKSNMIYFITRYVKNIEIAEDIFQEVILYILENKEKYDNNYSLKTYLYTIAKSKAINYLKKEERNIQLEDNYISKDNIEEAICSNENVEKIHHIIRKMPVDYQLVIHLTKIEKLSYKDTAKIMGKTENQIKTLAHNSKKKLKGLLIKEKVIEIKNNKVIKFLSIFLIVSILTVGVAYAGYTIYQKVWKTPEKYNLKEENEVTKEDKEKSLTKEEAIIKAKEITESLGKTFGNVTSAEINKTVSSNQMNWNITTDNKIGVTIDSQTGKLFSLSDFSIDDTKIEATMSKEEVNNVANEIYLSLGYKEGEYILKDLSKTSITNDTNLWQADFCKEYDGLYNDYQCVRITFIPEVKQISIYTLFDYKTENNPIEIEKEKAIEIAKTKAKELNNDESKIKQINAELKFEKINAYIYTQEELSNINNEANTNNETKIQNTDNTYGYKTEELVRKVWRVEIEYYSDFTKKDSYFVDCTTGEILGGDAIK